MKDCPILALPQEILILIFRSLVKQYSAVPSATRVETSRHSISALRKTWTALQQVRLTCKSFNTAISISQTHFLQDFQMIVRLELNSIESHYSTNNPGNNNFSGTIPLAASFPISSSTSATDSNQDFYGADMRCALFIQDEKLFVYKCVDLSQSTFRFSRIKTSDKSLELSIILPLPSSDTVSAAIDVRDTRPFFETRMKYRLALNDVSGRHFLGDRDCFVCYSLSSHSSIIEKPIQKTDGSVIMIKAKSDPVYSVRVERLFLSSMFLSSRGIGRELSDSQGNRLSELLSLLKQPHNHDIKHVNIRHSFVLACLCNEESISLGDLAELLRLSNGLADKRSVFESVVSKHLNEDDSYLSSTASDYITSNPTLMRFFLSGSQPVTSLQAIPRQAQTRLEKFLQNNDGRPTLKIGELSECLYPEMLDLRHTVLEAESFLKQWLLRNATF